MPPFIPLNQVEEQSRQVFQDFHLRTDADFDSDRAEVLIVTTFTRVDRSLLSRMPELRFIQVASTGYDNVDLESVRERGGIMLCNIPVANKESVAEHVIAMALAHLKDLVFLNSEMHAGRWPMLTSSRDLMGKTFGIVGMGAIGRRLAERLIAFEVRILYYDVIRLPEEEEERLGVTYVGLDDLLRESDIVSLHVPLTDKTRGGLLDERRLRMMKDGAILINTSRGGEVVDEGALVRVAREKGLRLGLDVFSVEPIVPGSGLTELENAILSPHIAGVTVESQMRFLQETVANVLRYVQGGLEPHYRVL